MSDDRLDKIILLLGQVDGKLEGLTSTLAAHIIDDGVRFGKIDKDLQSIKSKMNWGSGFASGVGAIVGTVTTLFFRGH